MRNFLSVEDIQAAETLDELKAVALRIYNDRQTALLALRYLDSVYVNHMNDGLDETEGSYGRDIDPWLALAESTEPKIQAFLQSVILGQPQVRSEN